MGAAARTVIAAAAIVGLTASGAYAAPVNPTFAVPDQYRAGTLPRVSAIADVDLDGDNDVVVTTFGAGGIGSFRNDGTGRLTSVAGTPLPGYSTFDLAVDDFDGDGVPDAAVYALAGGASVIVLTGNGNGTFTRRTTITTPGTGEVAAADIDNDGDPDLAYSHGTSNGEVIKVVENNGNATFGPPTTYSPGIFISHDDLQFADANGDGLADLVYQEGCPNVRLNLGNGAFGDDLCSTDPQGRIGGFTQALGDFDGDGDLDMATGNASGERVSIAKGNNTGFFTYFAQYNNVNSQLNFLVTADLTGDGVLDLLAGSNTGVTELLAGNGNATFQPPVDWITGGTWLTLGDLGGSPLPDLVSGGGLAQNEISVSFSLGGGRFDVPRMYGVTGRGRGLDLGDVNGDGREDVASISNDSQIETHLAGPDAASFGPAVLSPVVPNLTRTLVLADVNSDGDLDAVGVVDQAPRLYVALGNGDGTFAAESRVDNGGASTPGSVQVADIDGDGNLDLISPTSSQISVVPGNGNGTFDAAILSGQSQGSSSSIRIGDIDGDGEQDVVASIRTGSTNFAGTRASIDLGNGDGSVTFAYDRGTNTNQGGVDLGDLDGDGLPELVVVGTKGFKSGRTGMFVFENEGGVLATVPTRYTDVQTAGLFLEDMNGDGTLDPVTIGGIAIGILPNDGTGTFSRQQLLYIAADRFAVQPGDLTGDGQQDLVVLYGSLGTSTFAPYVNTTP